ncbi:hypothetical protein V8G54_000814 [Vigna mungo]|uniref:Integrase catalytic domain-containing protein n=1 Tax=Vigna mungo TaxID=3915 RepID=A0AAQ3P737_VIGMU
MTNQVAGLVSVVHKLTGRAAENTPATIEFQGFESQITSATASSTSQFYQDAYQPWQPQFGELEQQDTYSSYCMAHMWRVAAQLAKESNEAPLGTTSTIEFQADSNPSEEVDGPDQVYSELDIPIHVLEVQIDINALDLLRVEPIKPAIDTADLMPAHTHILDSVFHVEHIDIPDAVYDVCTELDHSFDDNFVQCAGSIDSVVVAEDILYESIQVYCNLETSTTSSEFTIPFDAIDCICIDPIEPVVNSVELIDSKALKAAFEIEHIDVSIVVTELYIDFDTISIDGSCSECDIVATESSHTGEVVLEELVQVESDFNLAIGLSEMCPAINHLHALPNVSDTSEHSKLLDTIFAVHHIKTPTDGCSELKAAFSDDMINDLLSDDNIIAHAYIDTHANFELDVGAAEFSEKEAAGTEANLVEAGDGLNETQGPWNVQYQQQLHEEPWLLQKGVWKAHKKLPTFDGELTMIRQRAHGETPKTISSFLSLTHSHIEGNVSLKCGGGKEGSSLSVGWLGLKVGLINRFGGGFRGTVYEQMATLWQKGMVENFIRSLEILLGQTQGLSEELILGFFLAGLREEIKGQVNPVTVRASTIVRGDGDRHFATRTDEAEGVGTTRTEGSSTTSNTNARGNTIAGGENRGIVVRNLPYPEFLKRREEGRCFRCGGPFAPGHRCSKRSLRILLLAEDEEEESNEETVEEMKPMELSACSAEGLTPPKTMKLTGLIGEQRVVVLNDSGASHNFISRRVMEELELSMTETPPYVVSLGDGHKRTTSERCEKVRIRLGDATLGGVDVILGIAWLAKLGEVVLNWREMSMKYVVGGDKLVEPKELLKMVDADSWVLVWELGVVEAVLQFQYCVFREREGLPPQRSLEQQIMLKEGEGPINVRPYRQNRKTSEGYAKGEPYTTMSEPQLKSSDFGEKEGRELEATVLDKFPIPVIEELLDELKGARYLSKLDLKVGYHQIRMGEEDVQKTTFRTHQGHFEFLVMPFGLTNAPATFQSAMNDLMAPYLRKWPHLGRACRALEAGAAATGATLLGSESEKISKKGVEMDQDKIKAVMEWEEPKNLRALRGFLGLTGYYKRFIQRTAMAALKAAITSAPVLILPDYTEEFHVECDASGGGVRVMLMQNRKPIAFFSKALSEGSLSKSIYEKEWMALVMAIQHWRSYLKGGAKLMGYDFVIVYKMGSSNKVADVLSRKGEGGMEEVELRTMTRLYWHDFQEVLREVEEDETLRRKINDVKRDPNSHAAYTLENDRLHYKGRLVLSAKSVWIPKLLAEFHVTSIGGHYGVFRTYRRIPQSLYWSEIKKIVTEFVARCVICQQHKYIVASPQGLLQPLSIPQAIWEEVSLDFIVKFPKSHGFDAILVVVDSLSKYGHFIALKHPYSARTIVETFTQEIVRLHGIPMSIVSDRDPLFLSVFWRELSKMQGTQLRMSTTYHPETDVQTEVLNNILEGYLSCFCSEQPRSWRTMLPWAEYWYNTNYQGASRCSPFEIVYGRTPPTLSTFIPGETSVEKVAQDLMMRDEALRQLKLHLQQAQEAMVGDWVYLKIRPHRQSTMLVRLHPKLSTRYFGPFQVLQQVGKVAFRLQLPEAARIHPIFHVSQLKKAIGQKRVEKELPTELQAEGPTFWPVKILEKRDRRLGEEIITQVLVEWQEGGREWATWEDVATIQEQYPEFNLNDKVIEGDGGNVRKLLVCRRRRDIT